MLHAAEATPPGRAAGAAIQRATAHAARDARSAQSAAQRAATNRVPGKRSATGATATRSSTPSTITVS